MRRQANTKLPPVTSGMDPSSRPTPLSEKRLAANRNNAQKSTGPRTPEGKRKSRSNAVKHGLTGAGTCLPPDLEAEYRERVEEFVADLRPEGAVARCLAERAALASVRLDRCARAEQARLADRTRQALRRWDEQRAAEVRHGAGRLEFEPAEAVSQLERTTQGVEWLLGQWQALAEALDQHGRLNGSQLDRLLRLLGQPQLPRAGAQRELLMLVYAYLALEEEPNRGLWDLIQGTRTAEVPRDHLPPPGRAHAHLAAVFAAAIERLLALRAELWEHYDGPERAGEADKALGDDSPEAARLLKYEAGE
ncbi:MAG: hypothetical protein IRY99_27560 [Isosphaeraceae bacterium]|nr:hypothetical protein [Isosphaeraceae bacterium]